MTTTHRIGIDARLIAQTGVGRYIYELVHELVTQKLDASVKLYLYVRPEDTHLIPHHPRVTLRTCPYRWHTWGEQLGWYRQLMKDKLHLMHFTYFSYPLLYRRPYVITLHDLTPLTHATGMASTKHPFIYSLKHIAYEMLIRIAGRQSKAIITPTHTVAKDVSHHLRTPMSKIHVTHEGMSTSLMKTKPSRTSPYPYPYFVYVGNMYPHKNVGLIVQALAQLPHTAHLVLVGARDHFTSHIEELAHTLGVNDRIIYAGKVEDSMLTTLYAHAVALAHPSLAEGFGLTPLEALYFGTPVIASKLPIFDEVLGDSYTPIDPTSVSSLVKAMQTHLDTPQKPNLSPKDIMSTYSFKTMAEKTWTLYTSLLPA